jgi:hypothetical protein
MNRRVGYGLAAVATALTFYYAIPIGVAIISLGEICPYSPSGTSLCATSSADTSSDDVIPLPASVSTQLKTGKLCHKTGIRYAGMTAEGAKVCFTLSPDGSEWLEIGFRFVRASGCANSTTGSSYYEGPEMLARPGRLEVHGFTATIRGSRASGMLGDSEACGTKRFPWIAGRVPRPS